MLVVWLVQFPAPLPDLMSEDEHQEMLRTASEAHADLKELALRLRRRLTLKAPATKAAARAEQEAFRLKRALQRFGLSDPRPPLARAPLPGGLPGVAAIGIERLRR